LKTIFSQLNSLRKDSSMQIEIDFEVYQLLTLLRRDESDTHNAVIRRLLTVSKVEETREQALDKLSANPANILVKLLGNNNFSGNGAWIGNVFFPDGTQFRATYKGRTHRASICGDSWIGDDGAVRQSPSEAASAISGTNVNGWRFWYGLRPGENDWSRLDEFRK
jgi:hypothetical protein